MRVCFGGRRGGSVATALASITIKSKLSPRSADILKTLQEREANADPEVTHGCHWVPEYGSWMVEGTPAVPYSGFANDLLTVESNMRNRRARLLAALRPDEVCPTVVCPPMLGVGDFTQVPAPPASAPPRRHPPQLCLFWNKRPHS